MELLRERAGADIPGGTNFQRNSTLGQQIHQGRIVYGGDAVADALDPEQFDCFANSVRPTNFAGMHQPMQSDTRGLVVDRTKFLRVYREFVAADAECDD